VEENRLNDHEHRTQSSIVIRVNKNTNYDYFGSRLVLGHFNAVVTVDPGTGNVLLSEC